jgi:hypothetical protein
MDVPEVLATPRDAGISRVATRHAGPSGYRRRQTRLSGMSPCHRRLGTGAYGSWAKRAAPALKPVY